jgi:hypothetical protein
MDEVFVWNPAATAAVSTIEATDGWKRFSLFRFSICVTQSVKNVNAQIIRYFGASQNF